MPGLPAHLGRYQIVGELATGGMAEILLGRVVGPSRFERPVVLKRILPHLARQPAFVEMFLDEARISARIRHPNVIHIEELAQEGGEVFLVMEYLEGESAAGLQKRLSSRGEMLPKGLAAYIVAEACAGLHAAHEGRDAQTGEQELVHRDVSPQNLFVTYAGQIKVLDFGIAKTSDRTACTEAGQIKGKFEYMSPEQCRGEPLDRGTDIFALGVVLYELTTGRRLFSRASPPAVLNAICLEPVVPPSRLFEDFPPALDAICMRALAAARADRYATAADMRRDLLEVVRTLATADPAASLAEQMGQLFADRIQEKRELLSKMRAGDADLNVPAGEVDIDVRVRSVTELQTAIDALAPRRRQHGERYRRRGSKLALVGLLVSVVGAIAMLPRWARSHEDAPSHAPVAVAAAVPPPIPPAPRSAQPAESELISAPAGPSGSKSVRVETRPRGSRPPRRADARPTPSSSAVPRLAWAEKWH
jgi:eukaryotic-like serine/threonine-protein kinase